MGVEGGKEGAEKTLDNSSLKGVNVNWLILTWSGMYMRMVQLMCKNNIKIAITQNM